MILLKLRRSLSVPCFAFMVLFSSCSEKPEAVSLFDGKTLEGWHAIPRIYVPSNEEFDKIPSGKLKDATVQFHREHPDDYMRSKVDNIGVWKVEDGAITGAQVPGTVLGA